MRYSEKFEVGIRSEYGRNTVGIGMGKKSEEEEGQKVERVAGSQ